MKTKWIILISLVLLLTMACSAPALTSRVLPTLLSTAEPTVAVHDVQPVQYDPTLTGNPIASLQDTFTHIYQNVSPSVVYIAVSSGTGAMQTGGVGSGFVWDTAGHIVTNNHVVNGATQINVTFSDGTSYDANLVGADSESDLAVIQVNAPADVLHPVAMADSSTIKVGDLAIAIGNPFGLTGTMTQGIVSALSRSLPVDLNSTNATGSYTIPDIIQTDAAINPGNSGGVLLNANGEVMGVTSAIESSTNSNSGIGYAIPSQIVQRVVPVLIKDGAYQHPRLGIAGVTLNSSIAKEVGLDPTQRGVLVVSVTPNTPAEKAGLIGSNEQQDNQSGQVTYSGGDVITGIDGQTVNSFDDLTSYLFNNTEVGQTVTLTILRNGTEIPVQVTLAVVSR
jgi:serine protease Do